MKIEILDLKDTRKTLIIDDKKIFCEKDEFIYSEMMAHVPICTHKEPKRVLIIGANFLGVAREALRHPDIEIDLVEKNEELIETLKDGFKNIVDFENKRLNLIIDEGFEFVRDAKDKSYDLVLVNSEIGDKTFFAHINRILKDDGLVAAAGNSPRENLAKQKEIMEVLGDFFKIVMPYRFEMFVRCDYYIILASKFYHPTADMILQRADLIDGLNYYNSDIHKASFVLPEYLKKEYGKLYKW